MRGARCLAWVMVSAALVCVWPSRSWAIPVFARKYGFDCTMCHVQFPKLNDFGVQYRDNGYRLPGKEAEEQTVFETPTPVAMRTSAGYNHDTFDNPGAELNQDLRQFQVNGLDVLSGGLFSDRIGYFMVFPPQIKGSRGVVAQDGTLEMANVVYALRNAPLPATVRIGRFEPAYDAFSVKRSLSVAPYAIYDFAGPDGFAISDTQSGIEFAGALEHGVKLAVGWVDGSSSLEDSDSPQDFYLRASKVFGRGEGQTSGQRLGAMAYLGRSRPPFGIGGRDNFHRLGVDASLNYRQTNLMAQYLWGKDDAGLNFYSAARDYDVSGGFVEVNHALPQNAVAYARWGWVNTPSEQDQDRALWTVGARYYPAMNMAVQVEYFRLDVDHGAADGLSDYQENFLTTRLDFAF